VPALFWLVVIGTSIWVLVDASNLGVRSGALGGGFVDIGVVGWFVCCLLLWIVAFPAYLITRPRYAAIRRAAVVGPLGHGHVSMGGINVVPGQPSLTQDGAITWAATPRPHPSGDAAVLPAAAAHSEAGSLVDELARLSALRQSGALTDSEFEDVKARLLGPSSRPGL
jgi:hypothetical protein